VGHVILGRRRLAAVWLAIGLSVWGLIVASVRLNFPVLFLVAFPCLLVAWLASLVSVGRTTPAQRLSTRAAWAVAAAVFGLALVVASAQRLLLIEAFQVPSGAMMPTLEIGDHFYSAKGSRAEPGDVIVFKYPADPEVDYVKRVVARGGDTIEIKDDVVFINGQELPQTRLPEPCPPPPAKFGPGSDTCVVSEERNGSRRYRVQHEGGPFSYGPTTIPAGHLFVMGDNRHNSNDSRVWGTVPGDLVKAQAQFIWWSRFESELRWGRIGKRVD
jgi:signal peptidase I